MLSRELILFCDADLPIARLYVCAGLAGPSACTLQIKNRDGSLISSRSTKLVVSGQIRQRLLVPQTSPLSEVSEVGNAKTGLVG